MRQYVPAGLKRRLPAGLKRRLRRWLVKDAGSVNLDRYRYVFIVTYGRSGSTLLMSILNTIPGYRINGENYNALYRLYQADAAITESYRLSGGASRHQEPQSPWYGMPRARPAKFRQEIVTSFVQHILRPGPHDRVLGFKEIRYTKGNMPDLDTFLDFLLRSFPNCKIVFNHRDLAATAKSSWWALDPKASEKLAIADGRMWEIPAGERHFHFVYDEIDDSLTNVRALFEFLGERLDEAAVRQVLNTRHSPPPARYAKQPAGEPAPRT